MGAFAHHTSSTCVLAIVTQLHMKHSKKDICPSVCPCATCEYESCRTPNSAQLTPLQLSSGSFDPHSLYASRTSYSTCTWTSPSCVCGETNFHVLILYDSVNTWSARGKVRGGAPCWSPDPPGELLTVVVLHGRDNQGLCHPTCWPLHVFLFGEPGFLLFGTIYPSCFTSDTANSPHMNM